METLLTPQVVGFVAGPGGAMVLLALVLYMAYKIVNRLVSLMATHLERIEQKFDTMNSTMQLLVSVLVDARQGPGSAAKSQSATLISLEREVSNGQQK